MLKGTENLSEHDRLQVTEFALDLAMKDINQKKLEIEKLKLQVKNGDF